MKIIPRLRKILFINDIISHIRKYFHTKGRKMTDKEKIYFELFEHKEYLNLEESCKIWRKPGYSTLSKKLPKIGYIQGVQQGLIPKYKFVSGSYLFKIRDILDFLEKND